MSLAITVSLRWKIPKIQKAELNEKTLYVSKVYLQLYLLISALEIAKATIARLSIIGNDNTHHILIFVQQSKMQRVTKQGQTLPLV